MPRKFMTYAEVCVFLLIVMSSCAFASLVVQFHKADYYYVGEEAMATVTSIGGIMTHVYTVAGDLPPGCKLEQDGGSAANITGKPITAGTYNFTVNVRAKTLDYSSGRMGYADEYGSVNCTMIVRPSRSGNGNTDNDSNGNAQNNTGGNNTNNGNNTGSNNSAGSSGGGGCNSFAGLGVMLLAVIAFRKSHR